MPPGSDASTAARASQAAPASRRAFVVANAIVTAVFLLSAAAQYNDPDPLRWVAMYAAGASACLLHRRVAGHRVLSGAVTAAALLWAVSLAGIVPDVRLGDLFRTMKADTPIIEESREFLGLLLVAGWTGFLTLRRSRRTNHAS